MIPACRPRGVYRGAGGVDDVWSNPHLQGSWVPALTNRATAPARMLILGDSMAEMVKGSGTWTAWPNLLAGVDRYFVPAVAQWGLGAAPDPEFGPSYTAATGDYWAPGQYNGTEGYHPAIALYDGAAVTWDTHDAYAVRVLYAVPGYASTTDPRVGLDGATPASIGAGGAFGDLLLSPPLAVGAANTITVAAAPGGEIHVCGLVVDRVASPQIWALNLSRSGAGYNTWAGILTDTTPGNYTRRLMLAFNPHLTHIGSWGWNARVDSESTLKGGLDTQLGHLTTLLPSTDLAGNTNPPIHDADIEVPGWNQGNQWIREWFADNDIPCVDWHATPGFPPAGADPTYWASDETHGTDLLSAYIASITSPMLMP